MATFLQQSVIELLNNEPDKSKLIQGAIELLNNEPDKSKLLRLVFESYYKVRKSKLIHFSIEATGSKLDEIRTLNGIAGISLENDNDPVIRENKLDYFDSLEGAKAIVLENDSDPVIRENNLDNINKFEGLTAIVLEKGDRQNPQIIQTKRKPL